MIKYIIPTVQEIKAKSKLNKASFEVVSLFAGGGGSSTGYRMAGANILAINEFIPEAIKTYKANWTDTKILSGDIRSLSPQNILQEINKNKGELDLLDGSPPCSAFSTVGSREKGWGKNKKYSDSSQENVEDLFFEYIRMLKGIQPRVFVAENVAGITKGKAKGYLNEILRDLKSCGYTVSCKILNAKWLGVPQSRTRAIFVGVRNDLWQNSYLGALHPQPFKNIVPLSSAFIGLSLTDQDILETNIKKYSIYKLLKEIDMGTAHPKRFSLKKAHPNKESFCITATNGNKGAANACHWENRAFSVSEIKRIMSIPDDYILTGTYQQKVERLGRMVAPLMMKAIANNLIKIGVFENGKNSNRLDV